MEESVFLLMQRERFVKVNVIQGLLEELGIDPTIFYNSSDLLKSLEEAGEANVGFVFFYGNATHIAGKIQELGLKSLPVLVRYSGRNLAVSKGEMLFNTSIMRLLEMEDLLEGNLNERS